MESLRQRLERLLLEVEILIRCTSARSFSLTQSVIAVLRSTVQSRTAVQLASFHKQMRSGLSVTYEAVLDDDEQTFCGRPVEAYDLNGKPAFKIKLEIFEITEALVCSFSVGNCYGLRFCAS
jgi:hypothetical protein